MAKEVPYEDLNRDFKNCIVMYKNKPMYVRTIGRDFTVYLIDILSQKPMEVEFDLDAFSSPVRRIGFVNCLGGVLYVNRIPVRKYYMGVTNNNITVKSLGSPSPESVALMKARITSLCVPELGDALMNKYPSIKEAYKTAVNVKGTVAFDKQFCVTCVGAVFFKGKCVGSVKKTVETCKDIAWKAGMEYLSILLDNNYEKTVRDFRPKAA